MSRWILVTHRTASDPLQSHTCATILCALIGQWKNDTNILLHKNLLHSSVVIVYVVDVALFLRSCVRVHDSVKPRSCACVAYTKTN